MTNIFLIMLALFSVTGQAHTRLTQFTCHTRGAFLGYPSHQLSFTISRLGEPLAMRLEGDETLVHVSPYHSEISEINLNTQLVSDELSLAIQGDSADVRFVTLRLWKKKQFQSGVLTYEETSSGRSISQKMGVHCKLNDL